MTGCGTRGGRHCGDRPTRSRLLSASAVAVVRRLRNDLAVVLNVVDPVLVRRVEPPRVSHDECISHDCARAHATDSVVVQVVIGETASAAVDGPLPVTGGLPLDVPGVGCELDIANRGACRYVAEHHDEPRRPSARTGPVCLVLK